MLLSNDDVYCGVYDSTVIRKNQHRSAPRNVECYELELFLSESGASYVNGERHACKRGMLLCAKPGQLRYSEFPVRCSFIRLFPTGKDKDMEALVSELPDCTYIENEADIENLMSLFAKLSAAIVSDNNTVTSRARINALLYEIIYRIVKAFGEMDGELSPKAPVSRIARDTYEFINESYTQNCSLDKIAEAVSASPNHIHAVFTSSFGITPYEYTLKKRIEKAEKLIVAGEKSMLEIALELGFCSQSHFNKMFKAHTGQTPAEYRRALLAHY